MHKKPLIAVLVLGLLLLAFSPVSAKLVNTGDDARVNALAPHQPRTVPAHDLSAVEPTVTIQAGTPRVVQGTFCNNTWQGPWGGWRFGGWFESYEPEALATFQDPNTLGSCAPGSNYTFDVTAVNFQGRVSNVNIVGGLFQPVIWHADMSNPACPAPGALWHAGPVYSVNWPAGPTAILSLPFKIEACVTGPYYAGIVVYDPAGTINYGNLGPSLDLAASGNTADDPVPPNDCYCVANDYYGTGGSSGWYGATYGVANELVWSEGYTPSDPLTHCTPGICGYQWWYYGTEPANCPGAGTRQTDCWSRIVPLPDGSCGGRTQLAVAFEAIGLDTLKRVGIRLYDGFNDPGDQTWLTLRIWDADGPPSPNCALPTPGTLRLTQTIPFADICYDPCFFDVTVPDQVWGTLNGGPIKYLIVSLEFDAVNSNHVNGTIVAGGDPTSTPDCTVPTHSLAFYPNFNGTGGPQWRYMNERCANGRRELWMDAFICKEKVPIVETNCSAGGPDSWPTSSHDFQRTGASNVNVGDPNGIKLEWTTPTARVTNFTSPVIANDRVYQSSDQETRVYDLAAPGAQLGQLQGAPEMGSANRGVTTVDASGVYCTGGNFNAVSKLGPDLETSGFIWSNNGSYSTAGNIPTGLAQATSKGITSIVNVAGTDVLFVTTNPSSGTSRVYAFVAATGALYGGWAINPITLDKGVRSGSATDGANLYIGTAQAGTASLGSLYSISAATGATNWNYIDVATEGWPGGVSVEGNFLYGITSNGSTGGHVYKLDKSGALPSIAWKGSSGRGLACPTIGRGFVYFPMDGGPGVLMVDKATGVAVHNFANEGVAGVTEPCALSCDAYLFVGDRNARWWLFKAVDQTLQWYRSYPASAGADITNGTALATHSVNGYRYAAVSFRSTEPSGAGRLSIYRLDTGPRPRLQQDIFSTDVAVPINSGPGQPHAEPGVFENIGNLPLTMSSVGIADPLPSSAAAVLRGLDRAGVDRTERMRSAFRGADLYEEGATLTKAQQIASYNGELVDGEFMSGDIKRTEQAAQLTNGNPGARSFSAASAAAVRTSNIKLNGSPLPVVMNPGDPGDLSWDVDGTGLGRGIDLNILDFENNDPDFSFSGPPSHATLDVLYVGGCLESHEELTFNDAPAGANKNFERVFSYGALGFQSANATNMHWHDDASDPDYDGGFYIAYDSISGGPSTGGALVRAEAYRNASTGAHGLFVGNAAPVSHVCGFDAQKGIVLGQKRTGVDCPGTAADILGEIITNDFADTNVAAVAGSRQAAIGVEVIQTEVGAYDPLYGDFKLIHWKIMNRDAVAKGPLYAGTWFDLDVGNASNNSGLFSDNFDGYATWDRATPGNAYGMFETNQPTSYCGVDPTVNSPYRIAIYRGSIRQNAPHSWPLGDTGRVWFDLVQEQPTRLVDDPVNNYDANTLLINKSFNLNPNGSHEMDQTLYEVSAVSNNPAVIEANAVAVAKRAARWGGYARGDVNDDGCVNLCDVAWLQNGALPIYPAAYCGDVNADGLNDGADITQLMSYVSGNAAARPAGKWRF
ncbi:MAG: hypothetical protein HY304_03350 [candidate division Zixibacteria bacterium]|nr:hypothetical protein [candidate division Zixibacteria bacterium]